MINEDNLQWQLCRTSETKTKHYIIHIDGKC